MAMPSPHTWTVEALQALPDDGQRYEVVAGELLVTPAPSWGHQDLAAWLHIRLQAYLQEDPVGHVKFAPQDIVVDDMTLVQPDLFVVPLIEGRRPRSWDEAGRLLLAIEIVSPSSGRADRVVKRRLYQRMAVPEYWIVDPDARLVERWRPGDERPEVITGALRWRGLTIDAAAMFADALD